jgi:hypothetical protein
MLASGSESGLNTFHTKPKLFDTLPIKNENLINQEGNHGTKNFGRRR